MKETSEKISSLLESTLYIYTYFTMDASRRILEEYWDEANTSYACPAWAPTIGFVGISAAVVFASKSDFMVES